MLRFHCSCGWLGDLQPKSWHAVEAKMSVTRPVQRPTPKKNPVTQEKHSFLSHTQFAFCNCLIVQSLELILRKKFLISLKFWSYVHLLFQPVIEFINFHPLVAVDRAWKGVIGFREGVSDEFHNLLLHVLVHSQRDTFATDEFHKLLLRAVLLCWYTRSAIHLQQCIIGRY